MKKSRRILCMFLAAVMLLGVVPAHAAAPLSPLAALFAIPVSGQLMNSGPVSNSISKALAVSKPSEPAPAPAPEPEPAPAAQTTPTTSTGRLPDGTTGATVGVPETATYVYKDSNDPFYGDKKFITANTKKYLVSPNDLTSVNAKANPTIFVQYDPQNHGPSKLAGLTVTAGCVADVYSGNTFLCQYDTRDGKDLVIPCALGKDPSQPQTSTPTKGRTTFNDVKPGDWYYEAVTACAEGNILANIFDTDPNGNFNPNAMVDGTEASFVWKRIEGQETKELSFVLSGQNQPRSGVISHILSIVLKKTSTVKPVKLTEQERQLAEKTQTGVLMSQHKDAIGDAFGANCDMYMPQTYYKLWKEMMADAGHDFYSPENQSNDAKAIRQYAQQREATNPNAPGRFYAQYENTFRHAYNLGLIRTPGSPEVIDLNAGLTRAEFCYLLYKAGLTSFGCNASK